jgi:hypothetical protein
MTTVIGTRIRSSQSDIAVPIQYECNNVGPDYFRTLRIPILRGREFTLADRKGSQPAVIVNESFARAVFGNRDPVGQSITVDLPNQKAKLVVGVAADSKYFTLSEKQRLAVYEPYFASEEPINLHFLLRTAQTPTLPLQPISRKLSELDATAAIEVKPMSRALGLAAITESGQRGAARNNGNTRADASRDGSLWGALLFGFTPHAGNRRAYRTGRYSSRGLADRWSA